MKTTQKLIMMIAAAIALLSSGGRAYGQDSNQECGIEAPTIDYDPTPKALEMTRYGNVPIDQNSGRVTFEIPIYTYEDQDFKIPVSLSYASSGFRPGTQTGEAGLGWTLIAGGAITRDIIGGDDFQTGGAGMGTLTTNPETLYNMGYNICYHRDSVEVAYPYVFNSMETTSDIYHFSFPGHNGSFLIGNDHQFHAYNTSDGLDTYSIEYSSDSFVIITSDGYRYTFGGQNSTAREVLVNCDPMADRTPRELEDREMPTVTWLLSKIEAPDGRSVEFQYVASGIIFPYSYTDEYSAFDIVTSVSPCMGRNLVIQDGIHNHEQHNLVYKEFSLKYTAYLTSIRVRSDNDYYETIAQFDWIYENGNEMGGETRPDMLKLARPSRKLSQVSFFNAGRTLRTAELEYTYDGCRPLLSSVDLSGIGEYEMSYVSDANHPLPGLTSNSVDYWGFYNGKDNADNVLMQATYVSSSFDETIPATSTAKDPDWTFSRLGVLSSVVYPTGGRTEFTLEANSAPDILLRRSTSDTGLIPADPYSPGISTGDEISTSFLPSIYPSTSMLHSHECGGVRVAAVTDYDEVGSPSTRTFLYSNGLVQLFPRYYVGNTIPGSSALVHSPSLKFPASCFDQLHVAYGNVREIMPDGSATLSEFSTWNDFPDSYSTNRVLRDDASSNGDPAYDKFLDNRLREPDSRDYRRGLLKRQRLYSPDNVLLSDRELNYQDIGSGYTSYIVGSGRYWWSAKRFICDRRISSETETEYFPGASSLVTEKHYSYDSRGRMVTETITSPDGETRTKEFSYMDNGYRHDLLANTTLSSMRRYEQSPRPLEKMLYSYSHPSGSMWNLTGCTRLLYDDEGESSNADVFAFSHFDDCGNPWQQTVNGINTAIVWGYGGRYQVARVADVEYSELPSSVSSGSYIQNGLTTSQESALRTLTGKDVSTFDYIPSVGATRITGPSGRVMSYSYDSDGRLSSISCSDSLLMTYTYGYQFNGGANLKYIRRATLGQPGIQETTVYDGLGRPWIAYSGNDSKKVVSIKHYDSCGMEDKDYLPYSSSTLNLSSALSAQQGWWDEEAEEGEGAYAFTESGYDNCLSPRSTWTRLPGSVMTGHASNTVYSSNAVGEVADLRFNDADRSVTLAGTLPAGSLGKRTDTDPDGKVCITFTDGRGDTVLERRMDGDIENDTYYVRDMHGRVVWVITPELSGEVMSEARSGEPHLFLESDDEVKAYCYRYAYDSKGDRSSILVPGSTEAKTHFNERHLMGSSTPAFFSRTGLCFSYEYDNSGRLMSNTLVQERPVEELPPIPILRAVAYLGRWNLDSYSYEGGDLVSERHHVLDTTFLKYSSTPVFTVDRETVEDPVSSRYTEVSYEYDELGRVTGVVTEWPDSGETRIDRIYDLRGNILSETERYASDGCQSADTLWLRRDNVYDCFGHCTSTQTGIGHGPLAGGTPELSFLATRSYDGIGRLVRQTVSDGSGTVSDDFSYTMQGWLDNAASEVGNSLIFNEELKYWAPEKSLTTPMYGGTVTEATFSRNSGSPRTEGYSYDGLGRITGTRAYSGTSDTPSTCFVEEGIGYDLNGNILSLRRYGDESLSENLGFSYDGNHLTSVTDTLSLNTTNYSYDTAGNLTDDGKTGLEYRYNAIGRISEGKPFAAHGNNPLHVRYIYLADGTKLEASSGDGNATRYRGSFILHSESSGAESLETIVLPEGIARTVGDSLKLYTFVKDHLGSVRAVVDVADSLVCEENDYYSYGGKFPSEVENQVFDNRWGYSGKEEQDAVAGLPYLDYGARFYDPATCRWLSPDPLAEKYYGLSPYGFCAGNPVNFVDPDGMETWVKQTGTNSYTVSKVKLNFNKNIYLVDENNKYILNGNGKKISIGKSLTQFSFRTPRNFKGEIVIDLDNQKGNDFIQRMTSDLVPLGEYMSKATNGEEYDFKVTDGTKEQIYTQDQHLRGMPISVNDSEYIASARDIGNYVAGYYAAANCIDWISARCAFDLYQTGIEEPQTQAAQYAGWSSGQALGIGKKFSNLHDSLPSLFSFSATHIQQVVRGCFEKIQKTIKKILN